jgi:hypothetical protein
MPSETRLVTIDQKQIADLQAMLGNFSARKFNVAMQAAISRTLDPTAVKMFSDRVKDTINLPVRDIKKQVSVKLPSFEKLVGSITMSKKPVPLTKYMGKAAVRSAFRRQLKKGVGPSGGLTFKVRKNGPVEVAPFAFVTVAKKGYVGVFQRIRNKGGQAKNIRSVNSGLLVRRFPIRLRMGPTAMGVLKNAPGKGAPTILDEIQKALGPVLQKNIASQIDRLLANKGFGKFTSYTHE